MFSSYKISNISTVCLSNFFKEEMIKFLGARHVITLEMAILNGFFSSLRRKNIYAQMPVSCQFHLYLQEPIHFFLAKGTYFRWPVVSIPYRYLHIGDNK